MKMQKNALTPHAKQKLKKFLDPDPDPDHDQNRIYSSQSRYLHIKNIRMRLLQNCGRYRANKQTYKQTRQITYLAKILSPSNKHTNK